MGEKDGVQKANEPEGESAQLQQERGAGSQEEPAVVPDAGRYPPLRCEWCSRKYATFAEFMDHHCGG